VIDTEPLRRFIRDQFARDVPSDDTELFPEVLDARAVIPLADFVEETYGIRLTEDDLRAHEENFRSLRAIADLIDRKRAPQG